MQLYASLWSLLPLAIAVPQWPHSSSHSSPSETPSWPLHWSGNGNAAAYFLENDPAGNSIVSLHIGPDGQLSQPLKTSTGGYGLLEVNGSGDPLATDTLGTQGAVAVEGNLLFTVNAGSNSVSMFEIDPQNPWSPRLVGSPADSQGEFPCSVTYSEPLNKACVLNGGAVAGVSCYSVDSYHGLKPDGPLRALSEAIIKETTPPSGPPGAASQVLFNLDSSALFATIRGVPKSSPPMPGSILVWPVEYGNISSSAPVVTQTSDLMLDFGFTFVSATELFLTDPSFGIAILEVEADWKLTEKVHTTIPQQSAICWSQYDSALDELYAIDAGRNEIVIISPQSGVVTGSFEVDIPGGNKTLGVLDSAIQNGVMYSLVATNGLTAVNLAEQKQIQYLDLSTFGNRQYYHGMAVWP